MCAARAAAAALKPFQPILELQVTDRLSDPVPQSIGIGNPAARLNQL